MSYRMVCNTYIPPNEIQSEFLGSVQQKDNYECSVLETFQ